MNITDTQLAEWKEQDRVEMLAAGFEPELPTAADLKYFDENAEEIRRAFEANDVNAFLGFK